MLYNHSPDYFTQYIFQSQISESGFADSMFHGLIGSRSGEHYSWCLINSLAPRSWPWAAACAWESEASIFLQSVYDGRDHSPFSGWGSLPQLFSLELFTSWRKARDSSFGPLRHGFITGSLFPEWLFHHLCRVVQREPVIIGHTSVLLYSPYYMSNPIQMKGGHLGHLREYPLQLFHSMPIMTYSLEIVLVYLWE